MSDVRIASLHVYPSRAAAASRRRADVATTGLVASGAGDREWMVVDARGASSRSASIRGSRSSGSQVRDGVLTLSAPDVPPLALPLRDRGALARRRRLAQRRQGSDAGDDAASWLSARLGADVRLVRFDRAGAPCNREYAGDTGAHTMFADGYPILVTDAASLADLNARLAARGHRAADEPLPSERRDRRASRVRRGSRRHDRRRATSTLRLVKPCTRCQVTTTDQATASVGVEPLPNARRISHGPS